MALIDNSSFVMVGGEIRNNLAGEHGGGIVADETSSVNLEAGNLGGNSAGANGGGIFTAGNFSNTAGVIWGKDAPEKDANRAKSGASLYFYKNGVSRETTLNTGLSESR
jgi:hypothetical protein